MKKIKIIYSSYSPEVVFVLKKDRITTSTGDSVAFINNNFIYDYNGACKGIVEKKNIIDKNGFIVGEIGNRIGVSWKSKKEPLRPSEVNVFKIKKRKREDRKDIDLLNFFIFE